MCGYVAKSHKTGVDNPYFEQMDKGALIAEFKDRSSGNVALCRVELKERYKAGRDMEEIAELFTHSNKSDKAWLEKQQKNEKE